MSASPLDLNDNLNLNFFVHERTPILRYSFIGYYIGAGEGIDTVGPLQSVDVAVELIKDGNHGIPVLTMRTKMSAPR